MARNDFYDDPMDREDFCRKCGGAAVAQMDRNACSYCESNFEGGSITYECPRCGRRWQFASRLPRNLESVCPDCCDRSIGNCLDCGREATPQTSTNADGQILCDECLHRQVAIWCPVCDRRHPYSGYLKAAFWGDDAGLQAAALVTHYRHEHRLSYDRACSNPSYAAKIPNYDYETAKQTTNNQAKRQLLRAIRKLVATGTYPPNAPASAMDLVAGFGRLDWNEPKTDELIAATLAQLSGA